MYMQACMHGGMLHLVLSEAHAGEGHGRGVLPLGGLRGRLSRHLGHGRLLHT